MKQILFKIALCFLLITFYGCSCLMPTPSLKQSVEAYDKFAKSFIGANINQIISIWGIPHKRYEMPNKNILYSYTESYMGMYQELWCEISFEANKTGTVINVSYRGNNCVINEE